jgi:predicted DNA-binding antitoxin AbrB/MazE fold protein
MSQVITATYADGMLKPDVQPNLAPGMRVRLIVEPLEYAPEAIQQAWEELERLCAEFPLDSGGMRLTRDQLHERR